MWQKSSIHQSYDIPLIHLQCLLFKAPSQQIPIFGHLVYIPPIKSIVVSGLLRCICTGLKTSTGLCCLQLPWALAQMWCTNLKTQFSFSRHWSSIERSLPEPASSLVQRAGGNKEQAESSVSIPSSDGTPGIGSIPPPCTPILSCPSAAFYGTCGFYDSCKGWRCKTEILKHQSILSGWDHPGLRHLPQMLGITVVFKSHRISH